MITITFWPRATRAGTINVDLSHTSRFETGPKSATFYLCHSDGQTLLDAMWAHGMRPSHIKEVVRKGNGK
jgi:hypothetical protein